MEDLNNLSVSPLMLKKNPEIVTTIKKVNGFMSLFPHVLHVVNFHGAAKRKKQVFRLADKSVYVGNSTSSILPQ